MIEFAVAIKQMVSNDQLHRLDRTHIGLLGEGGISRHGVEAKTPSEALDIFHASYPIADLENYDIAVCLASPPTQEELRQLLRRGEKIYWSSPIYTIRENKGGELLVWNSNTNAGFGLFQVSPEILNVEPGDLCFDL